MTVASRPGGRGQWLEAEADPFAERGKHHRSEAGGMMVRRIARLAVAASAAVGLGLGFTGSANADTTVPWWAYNGNQPNWTCGGTQPWPGGVYTNSCVAVTGDYFQSVVVLTVHSTQWADATSQDMLNNTSIDQRECAGTLTYGSYVCFGPTKQGASGQTVWGLSNWKSPFASSTFSPEVTLP
ncbi:hypothetical protein [Actinacidiphila acididurans]|uniref:Secreted protein n=1 Tax=Actinacidiphila acididurans TaxID=2784346 RepID=A0ABS2TU86_9ACTN|nr:hypothetical protein [Actinacidiphila acididurans]MBM9506652.1 hypothetical protein [Actinacidiphila acididurans]